jgi:hypothetical protein
MDGIAPLATTANVEVANRVNSIEKDNAELKKCKLIFLLFCENCTCMVVETWGR